MDETCTWSELDNILKFLTEYRWIHNIQVTELFKSNIMSNIPSEWLHHLKILSYEELNQLPCIGVRSNIQYPQWPQSLHKFIQKASVLSLDQTPSPDIVEKGIAPDSADGMNPKKRHEVSRMAPFINDIVQKTGCDVIIDVGSGLGYLDHVLHQQYGHRMLGLEVNEGHITGAERRALKQGINCPCVKSIKFDIIKDEECAHKFEEMIKQLVPTLGRECKHSRSEYNRCPGRTQCDELSSPRVCLVGLHCCGDLTPAVLSLFDSVSCVQSLCCVSCCYHKMAYSSVSGSFSNFPMSAMVKQQFSENFKHNPSWHLSPNTLRLGAHQTRSSWQNQSEADHMKHTRHVAYRALIEIIVDKDFLDVRKKVRKCDFTSFPAFLDSFFPLSEKMEDTAAAHRAKLTDLYAKHIQDINLIEIFTCLQVMIQPVVETLIHTDRMQWLAERGHKNARIEPLFDDRISPRNFALVACKNSSSV